MLKFYGSLSEENKKAIIKQERKILFLASLIPVLLGLCLATIVAININLIYLLFIIPLLFFLLIPFFPLSKKTIDLIIPFQILIHEDTITSEGKNFKCTRYLSDIKKVVDYGSYYQIYFKWPKKSCKFLCQKNLLVEEKIESFENLFKNKIEYK